MSVRNCDLVCPHVPDCTHCFPHRCKLFYKKDNEFKEKGVGTLHLKPTASQKTQLLVRADTNLGGYLSLRSAQAVLATRPTARTCPSPCRAQA